jgi:hypothetical protein
MGLDAVFAFLIKLTPFTFPGPALGIWLGNPTMSLVDTAVIGTSSSLELAALGKYDSYTTPSCMSIFLQNLDFIFILAAMLCILSFQLLYHLGRKCSIFPVKIY